MKPLSAASVALLLGMYVQGWAWGAAEQGAAAPSATAGDAPGTIEGRPHARRGAARAIPGATEFLARNASREGILVLPGGVQYRIIKDGTGERPQEHDEVQLIYRGTLVNGAEFGNTDRDGRAVPRTFALAALVPGLREAVSHMQAGSHWQVFIPPELGFGAGTPLYRKITVFDVHLVAVNP